MGRSQTRRTAAMAAPISLRSRNVSRMNRSTPPSSQRFGLFREVLRPLRRYRSCPTARRECRADRSRPPHRRIGRRPRCRAMRAPSQVDGVDLLAQAKCAQLDAIGAERVGFDDIGAGTQVFGMHAADQVGVSQVQRLEAAVDEDTLGVELRAHRAVADQHAPVNRFEKWLTGVIVRRELPTSHGTSHASTRSRVHGPREGAGVDEQERSIDAIHTNRGDARAGRTPRARGGDRNSAASAAGHRPASAMGSLPTSRRQRFDGRWMTANQSRTASALRA